MIDGAPIGQKWILCLGHGQSRPAETSRINQLTAIFYADNLSGPSSRSARLTREFRDTDSPADIGYVDGLAIESGFDRIWQPKEVNSSDRDLAGHGFDGESTSTFILHQFR